MPITRSATRKTTIVAASNGATTTVKETFIVNKRAGKRKAAAPSKEPAKKRARAAATKASTAHKIDAEAANSSAGRVVLPAVTTPIVPVSTADGEDLVPAVLTFSFEEAKQHLISVDPRFEDIFRRVKCKPYEHLEMVDPFRTLAHSILGQQISWKAAAAITRKFKRLFDPSISENMSDSQSDFFPSAHQVVSKDIATLRTAGLSGRKAEYVLDLAARFADGRLSTTKLLEADDEELHRILTEVRGIGTWTVNMFAIFSLRRPDILPVGDLGVQRGLLRWFMSLYSPSYPVSLRPDKLVDEDISDSQVAKGNAESARAATPGESAIPPVPEPLAPKQGKTEENSGSAAASDSGMALPEPFTPSINKTLNMLGKLEEDGTLVNIPPLPEGLTVAQMKTRLNGKNKIKGALLTPKEMEALTECWRPYRSLGVYYMWALAEEPKSA